MMTKKLLLQISIILLAGSLFYLPKFAAAQATDSGSSYRSAYQTIRHTLNHYAKNTLAYIEGQGDISYTNEEKSFAKKTYDAKIQYIADHLKNFGALSFSTATPAAKTHAPTKMQSSLKQKPQHNVSKSLQLFFAAIGILLVFISVIFLILSHHRKNLLKEHRQNEH